MVLTREQEVDAAFALASLPSVVGVFVLVQRRADVASEDEYMLAILLRPYSATMMVEAHYRLLAVVGRKLTGKVIYVAADVEPLPAFVGRARRITLTAAERDVAAARAPELEAEARHQQRLEEAERAAMEAAMTRALTNEVDAPVAISLDSGEFEIVRDPFPAPKDRHPRVLLVDDDEREAPVLRAIERIEIVHVHESWEAIEHLVYGDYDLALCALRVGDITGARLYRIVAKQRPYMAARIVFMAEPSSIMAAPPSSALGRVVPRPVSLETVRGLLEQWRQGSSDPVGL